MTDPERCEQCDGKKLYLTWTHANNDAKGLNRRQTQRGAMHVYRGPCGHWHVGREDDIHAHHKRNQGHRYRGWRAPELTLAELGV